MRPVVLSKDADGQSRLRIGLEKGALGGGGWVFSWWTGWKAQGLGKVTVREPNHLFLLWPGNAYCSELLVQGTQRYSDKERKITMRTHGGQESQHELSGEVLRSELQDKPDSASSDRHPRTRGSQLKGRMLVWSLSGQKLWQHMRFAASQESKWTEGAELTQPSSPSKFSH